MGRLVKLCTRALKPELLKGFTMVPWASSDTEEHLAFFNRGIDL